MPVFALDLDADDDMARRLTQIPADPAQAAEWSLRLKSCVRDGDAFMARFSDLSSNKSLSVADVIEIARQFGAGSTKSRKAALQAIASERMRLVHSYAKSETAARARNW
jgi:hypothetical protein